MPSLGEIATRTPTAPAPEVTHQSMSREGLEGLLARYAYMNRPQESGGKRRGVWYLGAGLVTRNHGAILSVRNYLF